jgi:hypothetical protein
VGCQYARLVGRRHHDGVTAALRFDPENVRMVDNIRYP